MIAPAPLNEGTPPFGPVLRLIADGLIARAELFPRSSEAGRLLRDAAASLLDADAAIERELAP